jgi:hypothetical protein
MPDQRYDGDQVNLRRDIRRVTRILGVFDEQHRSARGLLITSLRQTLALLPRLISWQQTAEVFGCLQTRSPQSLSHPFVLSARHRGAQSRKERLRTS